MVKKRSESYWDKRSIARSLESERAIESHATDIKRIYNKAQREVQGSIDEIYTKYLTKQGIDVKALTAKLSPAQTQAFWVKMKDQGHLEYIGANYKSRISRLEQIQGEIYDKIASIRDGETAAQTLAHTGTINEAFNRTIFDTSKGVDAMLTFGGLNTGVLDTMLNNKWLGGNYSTRIWGNTNRLANSVKDSLGVSLLTGRSPMKMSGELQEKFGVARYVADRLIRTETNYFQNEASAEAHEQLGLEKYKFVSTLDDRTSKVCQDKDDHIYNLKDKEIGRNYPPLHPNCRSTTRAYLGKEYEPETRTARDEEGNNVEIAHMSYPQWREMNKVVDVEPKNPPIPVAPKKVTATVNAKNKIVKKNSPVVRTLPIPVTRTRFVDEALSQVFNEGVMDVNDRYPMAFSRLDKVSIMKTADRTRNRGMHRSGIEIVDTKRVGKEMKDGVWTGDWIRNDKHEIMIEGTMKAGANVELKVPQSRNSIEGWTKYHKELNDKGWWSVANPKGVIYHELGHSLDRVMEMKANDLFGDFDTLAAFNGQRVMLNDHRDMAMRLNRTMSKGTVASDLVRDTVDATHADKSYFKAIKDHVSQYGSEGKHGYKEAFAELFAKHMNGDNDKITIEFGKRLDAKLGELGLL